MPITVVAKLKLQPGKEAAFKEAFRPLLAHVKSAEPGTLTYVLHRSTADPSELLFYEVYADDAAFAAHGGSGPMQQFFAVVGGLVAGRPEITMWQEVEGKKPA